MKKYLVLLLVLLGLLCTAASAETLEENPSLYPKAPAERLTVTLPEGMKASIHYADGLIDVRILGQSMSRADWKRVMVNGGYPKVTIRPGVKRPEGYDTCMGFGNSIFDINVDNFFNSFANTLLMEGVWYNNHAVNENGEEVGEIVADQCMLIPYNFGGHSGHFICWMDLDKYQELYPLTKAYLNENYKGWQVDGDGVYCYGGEPIPRHRFTAEEIKANKDGLFYFEYVEIRISWDTQETFYVPFRSVSAAMMAPTWNATMPSGISVKTVENGDITYLADGLKRDVQVPVVFDAPQGAAYAAIYSHWDSNLQQMIDDNRLTKVSGGQVTHKIWVNQRVCTQEDQLSLVWLDADKQMIDYGVFWIHVETPDYKPGGYYVKNAELEDGRIISWEAPPASRVQLINECLAAGIEATYDEESGMFHVSYDAVDQFTGELGRVGFRVKAPEGATAARINHGGGNNIMGPDAFMAQSTHHIIAEQSYIRTQTVAADGYITVLDMTPMRRYQAGPVDVYIQADTVWPYGGGQSVIYWYKDRAAAEQAPGDPLAIEYIADTTDAICVTSRTEIVEAESDIVKPVENVTCVKPGYSGKDWHLVIQRHPQRGYSACHWEIYLENECGNYEPLTGNTVFYVPYPEGHSFDVESGCAVDANGNAYTYQIYHYDRDYDECEPLIAEPCPFGIRFETADLRPLVLDWGN